MTNMSKPAKVIVGLLTLWPLGFVAIAVLYLSHPTADVAPLVILQLATIALSLGLLVFFVVDAYRSPRVSDEKRVLWIVLLLLGGIVAMPVYFWIYIRPA